VKHVLELIQGRKAELEIEGYQVHGTTIEDIFLQLMAKENQGVLEDLSGEPTEEEKLEKANSKAESSEDHVELSVLSRTTATKPLTLTNSRKRSALSQSFTVLYKRLLILRRSWLSPLLTILVATCGATIPIFFMNGRDPDTCRRAFAAADSVQLYLGNSPYSSLVDLAIPNPSGHLVVSPPGIIDSLGPSMQAVNVTNVQDNATFVSTIDSNFMNLSLGGLSFNPNTGESLIAWEGSPIGLTSSTILNLASNILYNRALNATGKGDGVPRIIAAAYQAFPALDHCLRLQSLAVM